MAGSLSRYNAKRDFQKTAEPAGVAPHRAAPPIHALTFVIQKHNARHLHYDFRLELDGVLLSWAVPKGPSLDPADKRLAVQVENHPLSYGSFEGTIAEKQYGAGTVIVWDNGTWEPTDDPHEGLQKGRLSFHLHGQKLQGHWELVRMHEGNETKENWLLFKKRDAYARARADFDVVAALPDSVMASQPPLKKKAMPAAQKRGTSLRPAKQLPGAVKAALPASLSPQLATLCAGTLPQGEWIFEVKYDGYRILSRFDQGQVRLFTRAGLDWTERMPQLAQELQKLGVQSGWLDGEIVVMGANGVPDFNALQNTFNGLSSSEIVYFVFDAPFLEGMDLRGVALHHRRDRLRRLLDARASDFVRYSEEVKASPSDVLEAACRLRLEGVIAKRADAAYTSQRTESWLKLKCKQRQEFVVIGYAERANGPGKVGSLLLAVHNDEGELVSVGSVGTGWTATEAATLHQQLHKLQVTKPPLAPAALPSGRGPRRGSAAVHWLQPDLVAEVEFAQWTPKGQIRHASFIALRTDKPAAAIIRERAKHYGATQKTNAPSPSIKVSHSERVIDSSTGFTKLDLVRYYESVAPWMLAHLKGRPVALLRGPQGIEGPLFFQKHGDKLSLPGVKALPTALFPEHSPLLEVPSAKALASSAQMNVVEFHTWNSTARNIHKPNRMVFDLDPGEGTPWAHVQEGAALLRTLLQELSLESWLKTSGGKGLHVIVPLAPQLDYAVVKAFAKHVVQHLAKTIPQRFVAKSGPKHRVGKLFVDYLRNRQGATTVAAFSARARPGMGVSMPVSWDDLSELEGGAHWTIVTALEHCISQKTDPWAGYWKNKQTLKTAMRLMGFK